jgi:HlyD family secretion protein
MQRGVLKIIEAPARVSGAAMDQPLPKRRPRYLAMSAGALVLLGALAAITLLVPRGLQVAKADIRIATVQSGIFRNDIAVRATVTPLHTTILDALDSGRVEEVLAIDGALVKKGELLYRLSNPQLRLDLVAREADRAQQISNLSNLRVSLETSQTDHQRRMLDLNFALAQIQRQHARFVSLAQSGVIAVSTLEDSRDRLEQQQQARKDELRRARIEMDIKHDGIEKMRRAIEQLDAGLEVVTESIDALAVRAPIAGRLTDFHLQLGEIVKSDQHIGRIDDPGQFKLVAQIDEYFLARVSIGQKGTVNANGHDPGRTYGVEVSRIFPQIEDGRFSVELLFVHDPPPTEMGPGQSLETHITLGETSPGLILPDDAFLNDTGGSWVFVLSAGGETAERRAIRVGRRNNSQLEVSSGLKSGERVIVSAYAPFGNAQRLQITQ